MVKRAMRAQQQQPDEGLSDSDSDDELIGQPRTGNAFGFLLAGSDGSISDAEESDAEDANDDVGGPAVEPVVSEPSAASHGQRRRRQQDVPGSTGDAQNDDAEEMLLDLARTTAAPEPAPAPEGVDPWQIDPRHLDGANELSARFGKDTMRKLAAADRLEQRHGGASKAGAGGRGTRSRLGGRWLFGAPRDAWPPVGGGLGMEFDRSSDGAAAVDPAILNPAIVMPIHVNSGSSTPASFIFSMSRAYRELQVEMEMATATGDPNALQQVLAAAPFNPDGLVRLSDYCRHTGQNEFSSECIAKALHACEVAFHPQMRARLLDGSARLRWSHECNRPFHRALFRQMQASTRCGCHRTALELGRLLFSLDPEADPLHLLLHLDFLALMAGSTRWLLGFPAALPAHSLLLYPQCAFSLAVAMRIESADPSSATWADLGPGRKFDEPEVGGPADAMAAADVQLCRALLLFPALFPMLVRKVAPAAPAALLALEAWEDFFMRGGSFSLLTEAEAGSTLGALLRLYVTRHAPFWKERPMLWSWLLRSAESLLNRLASREPHALALAADCAAVRQAEYFSGAHEHNEFLDLDPSDFSMELPAQLPAEALAAAMADPDGPLPDQMREVRLPGRLVVPRAERLQLSSQTHPLLQFFYSLIPWAMPPPNRRARAEPGDRHEE
jgi:hypothetical protein